MRFYLTALFFTLSLMACNESKEPALTTRETQLVDSLFNTKSNALKKQVDSLCLLRKDSIYTLFVDSILNQRRVEIEALMKDDK